MQPPGLFFTFFKKSRSSVRIYLPIQNFEKTLPKISSVSVTPTISLIAPRAPLTSSATNSPELFFFISSSPLVSASRARVKAIL